MGWGQQVFALLNLGLLGGPDRSPLVIILGLQSCGTMFQTRCFPFYASGEGSEANGDMPGCSHFQVRLGQQPALNNFICVITMDGLDGLELLGTWCTIKA